MDKLRIIDSQKEWAEIYKQFPLLDCYYSFEYGDLFSKKENGTLFAAFYKDYDTKIFYPFIRRQVPDVTEKIYDIITPYGYGGPIIEGRKNSVLGFYQLFSDYCRKNCIITETIRFHPLYKNHQWFESLMDVSYIRQTTAVDLTSAIEEIRAKYSSMNKRNIKTALKNQLTCSIAEKTEDNIQTFIRLYNETMDRNHAADYYYFHEDYFYNQLMDTENYHTFLLFAKKNNEVVAGIIILVAQNYSHYHLGASATKDLGLKPNNLLFDCMIEFCKSKGSKQLHLGGGYQEGDGLFKFKSSFTNNNHFPYFIGKRIHDVEKYNKIIEKARQKNGLDETFFPAYRGLHIKKRSMHEV